MTFKALVTLLTSGFSQGCGTLQLHTCTGVKKGLEIRADCFSALSLKKMPTSSAALGKDPCERDSFCHVSISADGREMRSSSSSSRKTTSTDSSEQVITSVVGMTQASLLLVWRHCFRVATWQHGEEQR